MPGFPVHAIFQARILEWVAIPSSGDLPDPGIEPESYALPARQADSLPVEPLGNWQIGGEKIEAVKNFIFLGSKITSDSVWVQEIKRHFVHWKM